jgi:hypothetical protein
VAEVAVTVGATGLALTELLVPQPVSVSKAKAGHKRRLFNSMAASSIA